MSIRSNREAAKLTLSWLPEAGVREIDLIATVKPLAKMPSVPPPDLAPSLAGAYKSPVQCKRDNLLEWATAHCFPQMLVRLARGRLHVILPGESSWRFVCRTGVIEIIESALEQSVNFQLESEEIHRGAFTHLGRWRNWERFAFKPSSQPAQGHQFTLIIGDGTEAAWMQFAQHGSFAQLIEACELLEQEWIQSLLAWGQNHDFPELTYCCADGEPGVIPAGAEIWRMVLAETLDLERIQMSMEAQDLDELESAREE